MECTNKNDSTRNSPKEIACTFGVSKDLDVVAFCSTSQGSIISEPEGTPIWKGRKVLIKFLKRTNLGLAQAFLSL